MAEPAAGDEHPHVYPKNLNPQIHGLRGLATLLVFIYHLYGVGNLWGFWPTSLDPVAGFFLAGRHGVEIFFIISGYLITGSLLRHQQAGRFLLDRCIRIYPVFLAIQILVFALGPVLGYKWMAGISLTEWATAFAYNGLFLPGLFELPLAQLNAWSLSYEVAFYLVCAAGFVAARRLGKAVTTIALSLVVALLLYRYPVGVFFLVGVAIFFLVSWRGTAAPRALRRLSLVAFLLTLGGLTVDAYPQWRTYLVCLPALMFFWSIVDGRCALSAFLRHRLLQYFGTISYSFYLWSPFVTYPMKLAITKFMVGHVNSLLIWSLFAILALAASIIAAHLSYIYLEDRAGTYLRTRVRAYLDRGTVPLLHRPAPVSPTLEPKAANRWRQ
jgi:peptidoglycan/LPS O-acetylase OafA/YrhL